jgi:hypothetical protein
MKSRIIFLLVATLTIVSCKTKPEKSIVAEKEKDTLVQLQIDTTQYSNLPYWTSSIDRFSDAYIDTFSVGTNKFRFVNPTATHQTGGNSITLQKLINGKWTETNLILEDNIHGGNFFHDQDINGDGYIDIVNTVRFTGVVYFYNPKINSFIDTAATEEVNPDWVLLDKAKNIYCDFQEFKRMCGQIHSTLYTYKEFKKINLYDLELYNCTETNNDTHLITKLILSKCENGSLDNIKKIKETVLKEPLNTEDIDCNSGYFDYKKYWLEIYKKLLGSS